MTNTDNLIKWIEEEHKRNCEEAKMSLKKKINSIYGLNGGRKEKGEIIAMTITDILKDILFLHIEMKKRGATAEEFFRIKNCIVWLVMNADEESEKTYDLWKEVERVNNISDLKSKYQNNDIPTIEEA